MNAAFRSAVVCLLLAGWLTGAERPNLLFLLADDQRPDTIGAMGHPRIRTPHLDALAARGTLFTRTVCSYPICVVSRAEILTGRHGWENGLDGVRTRFRDDVTFWAATLPVLEASTTMPEEGGVQGLTWILFALGAFPILQVAACRPCPARGPGRGWGGSSPLSGWAAGNEG